MPRPTSARIPSARMEKISKDAQRLDVCQLRESLQSLRQQQANSLEAISSMLQTIDAAQLAAGGSLEKNSTGPNADEVLPVLLEAQVQEDDTKVDVTQEDRSKGPQVSFLVSDDDDDTNGKELTSDNKEVAVPSKFEEDEHLRESKFHGLMINPATDHDHMDAGTVKRFCNLVLSKPQFDWTMGMVIFANSICIGIETEMSMSDGDNLWPGQALDLAFITIYIIEILIRLLAQGAANFQDGWFVFDFILVALGVTSNMLVPLVFLVVSSDGDTGAFQKILVVRGLRLLRLIRAIRMLHAFRTVWRLVYGLITSGNAMASTLFLLMLTLYIFACLGVELIGKDADLQSHPDTSLIVAENFSSLPRAWLALMGFVCADSVSAIYIPLVLQNPWLILYFALLLLMVSVALMNLVTAVLVEGALENASNDKELERHDLKIKVKKIVPTIMEVFRQYDADGSGTMTKEEAAQVPADALPAGAFPESVESMADIFEILDITGDGSLTMVEFADGLLSLLANDVPIQTLQMMKMLQLGQRRTNEIRLMLEQCLPNLELKQQD